MLPAAKIVLAGYYGYKNAGDEIILQQILRGLKKHLPGVDTAVLTRVGSNSGLQDFKCLNRYNPFAVLRELLSSDALVMGGGGLFQDKSGKLTIYYYFLLIILAKVLRKKVIMFNQGVGPISGSFNKVISGFVFSASDLLIVRDKFSKKLVEDLTGGSKKVFLGADPVFSLKRKTHYPPIDREGVAVVLRKWKEFPVEKIARELNKSLKSCGYKSTVLNFHPKYDVFNLPGMEIIGCSEAEKLLEKFSSFKGLIGMRLHALMLGAIAGLPMVGINYDPKVKNFCSYMNIPYVETENCSAQDTVGILQKQIKKSPDCSKEVNEFYRRLEKSWAWLKENLT